MPGGRYVPAAVEGESRDQYAIGVAQGKSDEELTEEFTNPAELAAVMVAPLMSFGVLGVGSLGAAASYGYDVLSNVDFTQFDDTEEEYE